MKGDRMPSMVTTPLSNVIGEDYTDSWVEFLLDPIKLDQHLKELKLGKTNHPNASSIIKTLLKQYEKFSSTQPPTKRSRMLIHLSIVVCTSLSFTLDDFEKIVPIKHQRALLEDLESSDDDSSSSNNNSIRVDIEKKDDDDGTESRTTTNIDIIKRKDHPYYKTFLSRWVLRGIIKGTPLKYLLPPSASGPNTSPQLAGKNPLISPTSSPSPILLAPQSPSSAPSTPPPTPPSYIYSSSATGTGGGTSLSSSSEGANSQEKILENMITQSREYLEKWIKDNQQQFTIQVSEITLELGEYHFYKEEFKEALKLFESALEIIKDFMGNQKKMDLDSEKEKGKSIDDDYTPDLSFKDRIESFIIACKTLDYHNSDKENGDTKLQQQQVLLSVEKQFQLKVEEMISKADFNQLKQLLEDDILKQSVLDWNLRLDLENLHNNKQQQQQFITEFEKLIQQYGPPPEPIAVQIIGHLLNLNQWNTVNIITKPLINKGLYNGLVPISSYLSTLADHFLTFDGVRKDHQFQKLQQQQESTNADKMSIDIGNNPILNNTKLTTGIIESFTGFLSSVLPKYKKINYHWTSMENNINNNNSNNNNNNENSSVQLDHNIGLLGILENKKLLEIIASLLIGLLHSIQIYKKSSNELNLEIYDPISKLLSTTLSFPNKYLTSDSELFIIEIYLETLNRINSFGLNLEREEGCNSAGGSGNDESSSSQVSSPHYNGKNLCFIGDIYFEKRYYRESLRYYLLGCGVENSFFSTPTSHSSTKKTLHNLSYRIFQCLHQLRSPMQAIVVTQMFKNLPQACSISFKIIQEEFYQLDPTYFQFIWEMPILEMLMSK
eukprot:gene4113-5146_t